jgi:hypothetical protein
MCSDSAGNPAVPKSTSGQVTSDSQLALSQKLVSFLLFYTQFPQCTWCT